MKFELNFLKTTGGSFGKSRNKTPYFTVFFSLVFIGIISYLLYIPQAKFEVDNKLQAGDIVKKDIIIEKDITVEDKESTDLKKKLARENIIPVYEYNEETISNSKELLINLLETIPKSGREYRKKTRDINVIRSEIIKSFDIEISEKNLEYILRSNLFSKLERTALLGFMDRVNKQDIIYSKTGAVRSKNGQIKIVAKQHEPRIIKVEDLVEKNDIETELKDFIAEYKFTRADAAICFSVLKEFFDANISYSVSLTNEERANVLAQVNPVLIKLKKGKIILRKGDEVTAEDLKVINLITSAEKTRGRRLSEFYLILIIVVFLFLFLKKLFEVWSSGDINKQKFFIVISTTLTISAMVYRISIFLFPLILKNISVEVSFNLESIFLAIPFGFGALIIAFIFNLHSAVIYSFINSIIAGIISGWNFSAVIYVLLGNIAAVFGIEYYQRLKRSPIFKASIIWMMPVNIAFIAFYYLTQPGVDFGEILVYLVFALFSAFLAPILANFIIPLWEVLFKLVTDLNLIELTNLNLPIFREMLEKAPGTYHHSQMVAALSEAAAVDLGLSPQLLTAMALYHDIGKIENPHIFTENHSIYKNPHDHLVPEESAKNIISHLTNGFELADKIKLPPVIRSAISQHHGNKMVRFFYDKALEMSSISKDELDTKPFKYPGDIPKNIENAIVMLADQVEAASKSLANPTDEEIKNVISAIISNNMEEKQFDNCDGLTFKALNSIANSFFKKLSSIYHMRISYPGFDFKNKEEQSD